MKRRFFFNHSEELWNSWSHFAGIIIGAVAAVLLLWLCHDIDDGLTTFSVILYIVGMLFCFSSSTIYHALSGWSPWKERLRKMDHAAIYWHIAGSYSPITLVALRDDGYWGWGLFVFVWACALAGTATSFHKLKAHSNVETLVFLAMGLCILVAIKPLYHCVSGGTFAFIIAEGACYLTGALFYTLHKHRYLHTVFHFFVLAGTICHITAVALMLKEYL
jgi:hemolysin III